MVYEWPMKTLLGTIGALLLFSTPALAQPGTQPAPPPPGYGPPPVYAPAPAAPAPLPAVHHRSGFTANLSVGLGFTTLSPDEGEGDTESGLAGLNLELGGFVSPELAISLSISGTRFSKDFGSGFGSITFQNIFAGLVGQYWLNNKVAVGGGVGWAIFDTTDNGDNFEGESGVGIKGQASYRFFRGLQATLSLVPSFYDGGTITSTSFLIGYQWD